MNSKRMIQVLALMLSGILTLSFFACTPKNPPSVPDPEPEKPFVYESPYDWSRLTYENGRFTYKNDWVPASLTGIDVSEHQGWINWNAVALNGVDFAIVRLGYRGYTDGSLYLDEYFYYNVEGARNAGLKVGVYLFSQAINEQEALQEAQMVLRALEGIPLDYPVFFDYEPVSDVKGRANNLSAEQLTKNAQVFCEHVKSGGYIPMIYGNKKVIGMIDAEVRDLYGVWFAEYNVKIPSAQFDFIIWQYSSTGKVAGIDTYVDLNIHFLYP